MQQKKETRAEIERRIKNAVVLVPRTKNTRSVYFADKGLRLTCTDDYTVIETGFHRHVFDNITSSGYSRVAMYIERVVDFALENDCTIENEKGEKAYSFSKLLKTLGAKKEKEEYNIATFVSWYLFNIFTPLYQISDNAASMFLLYLNYMHNIASQHVFLDEHKDGLTNVQFIEKYKELMDEFFGGITESPIFEPLSDEERMKQEMESLAEQDFEQNMKEQADGAGQD